MNRHLYWIGNDPDVVRLYSHQDTPQEAETVLTTLRALQMPSPYTPLPWLQDDEMATALVARELLPIITALLESIGYTLEKEI